MNDAQRAIRSGLTPETLRATVNALAGRDPVLVVGTRLRLYAVGVCKAAYGDGFRDHVGLAVGGDGRGWQVVAREGAFEPDPPFGVSKLRAQREHAERLHVRIAR